MGLIAKLRGYFGRLWWKLTLSYIGVTIGTLVVLSVLLAALLSRSILLSNQWFSPQKWIEAANRSAVPILRNILSQDPIDPGLIDIWLNEIDLQLNQIELIQIGGAEFSVGTSIELDLLVIGPDGKLISMSNPQNIPTVFIGWPFNPQSLPGLQGPFEAALRGEQDPERLIALTENEDEMVAAIPVINSDASGGEVLGVLALHVTYIPSQRDITSLTSQIIQHVLPYILIAAVLVGALFGSITARMLTRRLERLARVSDAWSGGDFSEFIDDPSSDEIGDLSRQLNSMAHELEDTLRQRQEMAVSEERNRLARELHDSAKQQALAASFQLATANILLEKKPQAARQHLLEAESLVNSVRVELANLIHELRPANMELSDMLESIRTYTLDWSQQSGIPIETSLQECEGLSPETLQEIYRILQEALANAARHSAATQVQVKLTCDSQSATLAVVDDGKGFNTGETHPGLGQHSMRERTEMLGGEFSIMSQPGQGTKVEASFPITNER